MTPLDRFLERVPGAKDVLLRLDEYLPFIVVSVIGLVIALVLYWTFVAAPRRATRILRWLEREGYGPVAPEDSQLKEALESLTPIMLHTYDLSTVRETSPWRVKAARARYDGRVSRYFGLINRSVSRRAPMKSVLEHQFTTVFLERRALPFNQEVHIAGDGYRLDPGYGLQRVTEDALDPLLRHYVVYTRGGTLDPVPGGLRESLAESAHFLCVGAPRPTLATPVLLHARLKFAPEGWGLISTEYVSDRRKMDALVKVVDSVSKSLP